MNASNEEQDNELMRETAAQWKRDGIYPYADEPTDPIGRAERNAFDVCAVGIHRKLPSFTSGEKRSRLLAMQLLRLALETDSSNLRIILQDVLDLAHAEKADFAQLLEKN